MQPYAEQITTLFDPMPESLFRTFERIDINLPEWPVAKAKKYLVRKVKTLVALGYKIVAMKLKLTAGCVFCEAHFISAVDVHVVPQLFEGKPCKGFAHNGVYYGPGEVIPAELLEQLTGIPQKPFVG